MSMNQTENKHDYSKTVDDIVNYYYSYKTISRNEAIRLISFLCNRKNLVQIEIDFTIALAKFN